MIENNSCLLTPSRGFNDYRMCNAVTLYLFIQYEYILI